MTSYRLTGPLRGTDLAEAWIVDGAIRHSAPDGPAQTVAGWAYPGLVDAHAHPGLSYSAEPVADAEVIRRLDAARAAGVTTVREMGAQLDVARFAARGRTKAIRSGRHIARPKRYIRNVAAEIEPRELPDEVVRQAARGDGWVKLVGDWIDRTEGADSDLRPLWPRDVLADAVAAAHEAGAKVALHTFAVETVDDALEAGVDCIEHGSGMNEDQLREAARRGVILDPTVCQIGTFASIADRAGKYPVYRERMLAMYRGRFDHFALMADVGAHFVMGTDTEGEGKDRTLDVELRAAVDAGLPAGLVMAAASHSGRSLLGLPSWEEGAPADVVVYAEDPEKDIAAVSRPAAVFIDGEPVGGTLATA